MSYDDQGTDDNSSNTESILDPLISASESGDLSLIKSILAQWETSPHPNPERGSGEPYHYLLPALQGAAQNSRIEVLSYLLSIGFPVTEKAVNAAVEATSYEALELFLAHGWDINNRWTPYRLPAIW